MADDVTSFFKSKKSKKHGSVGKGGHAIVQTPDELARRLERTVQQQQAYDRENGVEVNEGDDPGFVRPPYTQQFSGGSTGGGGGGGGGGGNTAGAEQINEDSEWFDYQEQQDVDVAKFGIKEMDIQEGSEDEANEEEEGVANRKTWNIPGQPPPEKQGKKPQKVTYAAGMDVDDGDDVSGDDVAAAAPKDENVEKKPDDTETTPVQEDKEGFEEKKPQTYVPPSKRNQQYATASRPSTKQPNLGDAMEFPSLAAAGELEAEIEKTKKKKPPSHFSKKAASPSPASAPSSASAESERQNEPSSEPKPTPWRTAAPPAWSTGPPAEPEKKPAGQSGPSAYVPPHLRKK